MVWQVLYAPFYQAGEKISGLYQVHLENNRLREQIANLTVRNGVLEEEGLENQRLRKLVDLRAKLDFEVIPAEVVSRDPNFRLNSTVISAGWQTGVRRDLPVIDIRGLAGKVTEVFSDQAVVQLLFDPSFRVSGLDQRSRVMGIISWKVSQFLELNYVPGSADVQVGDEIVTSGLSTVYPSGLKIGRVTSVSQDRDVLFKSIVVSPYADLQNLEELFVVKTNVQ